MHGLRKGEPISAGLKRIALDEIDSSAGRLHAPPRADRDEAIHEARKSIKKVRAILKLARPRLGAIYTRENAGLRDVARKLSGSRDEAAIVETFDDLKTKYASPSAVKYLASVRGALLAKKKQAALPQTLAALLEEAESALREIGKSASGWHMRGDGFEFIAPGLEATYRRGRQALARARGSPHPENYHQLRKRVKDLFYHIRLMRSLWTGIDEAYEKKLKGLEAWLGDDHNLVLLRSEIDSDTSAYGNRKDAALVLDLIDRYQKKLRRDSIASAKRLYEEKPREYMKRIQRLCDGG